MKTHLAAGLSAIALLTTGAASAATITDGQSLSVGESVVTNAVLTPGDDAVFTYTATEDLRIQSFLAFAGGSSSGDDLEKLTFGVGSPTESFAASAITTFPPFGLSFAAMMVDGPVVLAAGDTFTFTFDLDSSATAEVGANVAFETAVIPLPAGGLLLLGALGAGAALRRRKAKADA
jgi:hypothetical protein